MFSRLLGTALALAALAAAGPAVGLSAQQYLQLRRKLSYDPRLTYTAACADPAGTAGRVFEVRGNVSGAIQHATRSAFMLSLDDKSCITLDTPDDDPAAVNLVTSPRVRVLVRVRPGAVGNVAPLDAIAVASDPDVLAIERAAAARESALRQRRESSRRTEISVANGYKLRQVGSALGGLSELAQRHLSPEAQAIYPYYVRFIGAWNKRLSSAESDQIAVSILYFAQRHKVDPRLVVAMIIAESDFDPRSTSHKGAMGLGQVMPDEARAYGLTNPYDPIQNVRASVNMLRLKLDMYRDSPLPDGQLTFRQISLALAAYNAGSGAVRRYNGVPPYRETQRYVQRVLSQYQRLCGL